MGTFKVVSPYEPQGDQPQAIDELAKSIEAGNPMSVLLGVTGSGKTYTMAKVIERVQKPTLVLAHNKTLAAQLCSEFKELFPDQVKLRVRFSLDNLKLDDDVLNIPLFMADQADRLIGLALEKKKCSNH